MSAVSISSDGKLIVSYSVADNSVRFWQPSAGLLGALVGAFNQPTHAIVANWKMFRTFNVGAVSGEGDPRIVIEQVRFDWVGERGVKLTGLDGLELQFTV